MAGGQLTPLVSVNIPCYQQLALARRSVEAILSQSFPDLEVILLDDGASDDYRAYAESLADPRVQYRRNPRRLGAMRNMFSALATGRGKYVMAFHEDDLLSRGYLEVAVQTLDRDPSCGFVAGEMREFRSEVPAADLNRVSSDPHVEFYRSSADLVRGILGGVEPMFGSIVYRRTAVDGIRPPHDDYATLVDRPFLLEITKSWTGAVIREPLVWYRAAPIGDGRHQPMRAEHVIRLLKKYKDELPQPLSAADRALFFRYSGHWLFRLYDLIPESERPPFATFLMRVWRERLYEAKWRGRFGLRMIKRALVGQRPKPAG